MANFEESSAGYNWENEGIYQIEKNDPVEGGEDGVSNRQGRQLTHRTRDLHTRLVSLKTQTDGIIGQVHGGDVDVAYDTLLKLQNKLQAVETAISGSDGDALIETLQEALGFINDHKADIESLVGSYVKKTSIADNLTTTDGSYVLSARQGGALTGLIDALSHVVATKETPAGAQQKADAALASAQEHADDLITKAQTYDYVVDSSAKLTALANNPNATSVLIKRGTWTSGIRFMTLHPNTKHIVGEPGSVIRIGGFGYGSVPADASAYKIEGVTLQGAHSGFSKMVNLSDCKCTASSDVAPDDNDSNCFYLCSNLIRCSGVAPQATTRLFIFENCENMLQCRAVSSRNDNLSEGFNNSRGLVQCVSNCGIYTCYNVFMCKSNTFIDSHYGSAINTTYKCADTLNGGWNKVVTP